MISFWRIFWLEAVSLIRSRTLAMLTLASVAWMLVAPSVLTGDGTAAGWRELDIRYSLGGVFALLVVALLASATGSLARERAAKRLQLTMVRPVRLTVLVLAKAAALTSAGALVLALAAAVLACRTDLRVPCDHVLRPLLPSPREEAREMYAAYMSDPETPEGVKKARKSAVLRLLENRAMDHYQTLATNDLAVWTFPVPSAADGLRVRLRFTNQFDLRQEVRGEFRLGLRTGCVSNVTQAVVAVPLAGGAAEGAADGRLSFRNLGGSALMLRPRKDLELLVPADAFAFNLLRAYVELVSVLALVIAFGLFLSAALSRPVALFVALVTLLVGEMSPSVVDQYPDELNASLSDRVGLALTRMAAEVTRPVASLNPLERLSKDECVEGSEAGRVLLLDLLLLPLLLALLSAFVLPRKQGEAE